MLIYVSRSGDISKFHGGWLGKIVKKEEENKGHVVGKPSDSFKTIYEKKKDCKKYTQRNQLMQILSDPTHTMRHYSLM